MKMSMRQGGLWSSGASGVTLTAHTSNQGVTRLVTGQVVCVTGSLIASENSIHLFNVDKIVTQ